VLVELTGIVFLSDWKCVDIIIILKDAFGAGQRRYPEGGAVRSGGNWSLAINP
jgi:hypothetical protein